MKEDSIVRSKIVVVGDCNCGKTSLIQRYVKDSFNEVYTPTGFDTFSTTYNVSETYKIQITIWDTSGDAGYDRVRPLSYSEADLVMVCFSVTDMESLENVVSKWLPEVREYCPKQPIMLVGCKTDLRNELKSKPVSSTSSSPQLVSYDQGLKTAKHIGALVYSETSAKTSAKSVSDVLEVAALSSAGTKSNDSPQFRKQRSFIRRKRFSGVSDAKTQLRKEAVKSCSIM
ncbi:hypothetical protein LOTGIDRAFT_223513 [Lottia gigantea]|uniref:Uncharacterized protein n=1 Tax=Lottia gigantea TaxID=225164 RepID=V3ZMI5_LOTGI|nr:hypothetical protein LOTGIDRAFT_223513 [Lottia gigantea]ESO82046.1 hypothetical protein LOTGIDRAFT_223513 [Lottia gigantea]